MMNWKEHANLFANGKFHVKWDDKTLSVWGIFQDCFHAEIIDNDKEYDGLFTPEISQCTLIARKIEDMTDEEWGERLGFNYDRKKDFIKACNKMNLNYYDFLLLLSIGVYPFDQSHFETGAVIDIKTL